MRMDALVLDSVALGYGKQQIVHDLNLLEIGVQRAVFGTRRPNLVRQKLIVLASHGRYLGSIPHETTGKADRRRGSLDGRLAVVALGVGIRDVVLGHQHAHLGCLNNTCGTIDCFDKCNFIFV